MSGGDDVVVNPETVEQTAQGVATALGQAAEPGPVPYAAAGSPIDAAASAASGEVIALVAAGSGDLAPRAGEVMGVTQDALAGLQSADGQNTTDLRNGWRSGAGPDACAPGCCGERRKRGPGRPGKRPDGRVGPGGAGVVERRIGVGRAAERAGSGVVAGERTVGVTVVVVERAGRAGVATEWTWRTAGWSGTGWWPAVAADATAAVGIDDRR